MSLLRPRPNRRTTRSMRELSPFSTLGLSLPLSFLSSVSRALVSPSRPSPSVFLFLSISSQYLSAHLRAGFSRQTMHRATPSKTSTSLVAATRKRKKGRGGREDRAAIHAGSKIYFRDQKLSAHRFGNEYRRSQIFRMPSEIPRSYARF